MSESLELNLSEDHQRIALDNLVIGTLYEVRVSDQRSFVSLWLPYQGVSTDGRLIFADGPNGVYVDADDSIVKVWFDHNFS